MCISGWDLIVGIVGGEIISTVFHFRQRGERLAVWVGRKLRIDGQEAHDA